ncbi:DUF6262 family protein [Neobacillus sp. NPDC093127]|uniref:DUF6262 family protein n=1 Tax=Neobacillus sp. NPDC093127 TaxID=3364296 RepID=UPI0038168F4E
MRRKIKIHLVIDMSKKSQPKTGRGAANLKDEYFLKVKETTERLKRGRKKITVSMVSKESGVSRKTFYNRDNLMALVDEAISFMNSKLNPIKVEKPKKLKEEIIMKLKKRINSLEEEQRLLLEENMKLTESKLELQKDIVELEEKLYQKSQIISIKNKV